MSTYNEKYMRLAIEKAKEGVTSGQTPFGACIVKNDEVVVCEHNVVWKTIDITAHAEVHAIREACKKLGTVDLSGCIIYSTCEPCPMCFSAIHWAKISKIVYGTSINDAKNVGFNEMHISNDMMKKLGNCPVEIVGDFLKEESRELFDMFYNLEEKRIY
jgi:guanine deaminase